jgi:hypothetical protein
MQCLPSPGGLLDQDSFLVAGMDMVVDAQATKRELEDAQATDRRKKQPQMTGR